MRVDANPWPSQCCGTELIKSGSGSYFSCRSGSGSCHLNQVNKVMKKTEVYVMGLIQAFLKHFKEFQGNMYFIKDEFEEK